ncbi:nascent polypeptide-associated complex subunit alpha, muscle-specific form-like [Pan troglodytes]|uniref:nascent polypeptide-associated complex subunit alpha, muscle-specific form-like n=1 Tax=Pan troglodytes TaxID=9598 RepID=UPI003013E866
MGEGREPLWGGWNSRDSDPDSQIPAPQNQRAGEDAPAPFWGTWLSPSIPCQPLSRGFPRLRWAGASSRWFSPPSTTTSPPDTRIPVQSARRQPSVGPLLPAASVCPGLTSTPASGQLPLPLLAFAAAAAREGASQLGREGGRRRVSLLSPPVCSSPPLRSPPLRSAAVAAPAPREPPAPPASPREPRVTQATGPGTTRAPSLPLPTRASRRDASFLSPRPLPPTVTGIPGRDGDLGKTERVLRGDGTSETGRTGWRRPYEQEEGKEDGARRGEAAEEEQGGVWREWSLQKGAAETGAGRLKKGALERTERGQEREFQGAGGAGQRSPCKHGVAHAQDEGQVQLSFSTSLLPVLGLGLPSLSAAASTHHGLRTVTRVGRDAAGG